MMIREIHIYDLDGTVIDSTHRYRVIESDNGSKRIDLDFWVNNRHTAENDSLLPLADQVREQIADKTIAVIVATARQMHRAEWSHIAKSFGRFAFDAFISRRPGDMKTKGADLKIAGIQHALEQLGIDHVDKRFFYEDNRDYLDAVGDAIGAEKIFVESEQGY